jgi:hypothetical protein
MREMYPDAVDNGHFFDIFGVHLYSQDDPPSSISEDRVRDTTFELVDENFLGFTRMHEVLEREGEGDKPVYLGEYGFSTTWYDFLTYYGNAPWAIVDANGRTGATFENS